MSLKYPQYDGSWETDPLDLKGLLDAELEAIDAATESNNCEYGRGTERMATAPCERDDVLYGYYWSELFETEDIDHYYHDADEYHALRESGLTEEFARRLSHVE